VKLSTIAFAVDTDCLLVGDSEGQVVIYQVPDTLLHRDNQVKHSSTCQNLQIL